MKNLIASAGSKEALQKCINDFYYSTNYVITEDNKVYNTKLNKYLNSVIVKQQHNRWRFEGIS